MVAVEDFLEYRERAPSLPGPGDEVGDFVLLEEIGRGGSGIVFRARDVQLGREVALKLLPVDLSGEGEPSERRFHQEVSTLAKLRHPNIVEIYSAGSLRGFRYYAMRLVSGCTLADRIQQYVDGKLPTDVLAIGWKDYVLRVLTDVCKALAVAHERGIVHRDVKPQNILIDEAGRGLLVDFGLARVEQDDRTWTRGFFGTPIFASPEQTRGEAPRPSSDVFSWGSTLCAALTGVAPFGAGYREEVFERIRLRGAHLPRDVSADLRAVLESCLAKDARHRYRGAAELCAELERLAQFEPVHARPIGSVTKLVRRVQREPVRFAKIAAVAVVLVACAGAIYFAKSRGRTIESLVVSARLEELERDFAAGHFVRVERMLREAPESGTSASFRGRFALSFKKWRDALESLKRAVAAGSRARADLVGCEVALAQLEEREPRSDSGWPAAKSGWDHWVDGLFWSLCGDFDAANRSYARAVDSEPSHFIWRLARARSRAAHLRYASAAADYRALILQKPDDTELIYEGCQAIARVAPDEAMATVRARRAVETDPLRRDILELLYAHLLRESDPEQAVKLVRPLYAKAPEDVAVLEVFVTALIGAGRWPEARELVAKVAARSGENTKIAQLESLVSASQTGTTVNPVGDLEARRTLATRMLASKSPAAQLQGATSMAQMSTSPDEVKRWYRRAIEISPETLYARTELARQLLHEGESAQARAALGPLPLRKSPQLASSLAVLGAIEIAEKRPDLGLGHLMQAHSIHPQNALVCGEIAKAWLELDKVELAMRWAKIGVACTMYRSYALDALGRAHARLGEWSEAVAAYDASYKLVPSVFVALRKAYCVVRLGRHEEALQVYRMLQARVPSWPEPKACEGLLRLQSTMPGVAHKRLGARLLRRAIELETRPERSAKWRAALDCFRKGEPIVVETEPSDAEPKLYLGG